MISGGLSRPRPTFEPGGGVPSGLLDVCWMFARSCKRGITLRIRCIVCKSRRTVDACVRHTADWGCRIRWNGRQRTCALWSKNVESHDYKPAAAGGTMATRPTCHHQKSGSTE